MNEEKKNHDFGDCVFSRPFFLVNHTFVQCLSSAVKHAYLQGYVLIPYRKIIKVSNLSSRRKYKNSTHGTFANCSSGFTPWGTYLTCEENFQDFFKRVGPDKTPEEIAYGLGNKYGIPEGLHTRYGWDKYDPRYDADLEGSRNHANRFGWVVEIDPRDPDKRPVKRTALGRFRHENAAVVIAEAPGGGADLQLRFKLALDAP